MIAILIAATTLFLSAPLEARVFSRCEFLAELKKANVEESKLASYMCIADLNSHFNTKTVYRSLDSSNSVGVFQISDRYWCAATGSKNYCEVPCFRFLDDDISNDIQCARMVELREGFEQGWSWAYGQCKKKNLNIYTSGC